MAEKIVYVDGKKLNQRTADMLSCAEARLGYSLWVVQGSYNKGGVSASAGTHDAGGAVDVSPTTTPDPIVATLRSVGFAAWHRLPSQGPWSEHIHAIAIGDPELSSGAATQVHEYYIGQNGLASHLADDGPRLDPIPVWPIHFPSFSISQVRRQAKSKTPKPKQSVRYVQEMLNKRLGITLKVDGVFGPSTNAAFNNYKAKVGDKARGISRPTMNKLIGGYYKLKIV